MADKRIMCFGDSLTWGWIPVAEGVPTTRYPADVRWTGVLQSELGSGFLVIEEGLSARTTMLSDPTDPRLDGSAYLPSALASHLPLDLVILMLGTNDTKAYFHRTPFEIAAGMSKLVGQVLSSAGGVGTTYPAPEVLINEVVDAFKDRYDVTVEMVETAVENVEFKVPRVLREPA